MIRIQSRNNIKLLNMCTNEQFKPKTSQYHNNYMCIFRKITVQLVRKVLKVTVTLLPWIIVISVIIFLYIAYNCKLSNKHKDVSLLWWTPGFTEGESVIHCPNNIKCKMVRDNNASHNAIDAYLFYGSNIDLDSLPSPRQPNALIWALFHEESPRNVPEFSHPPLLELFNFSSTFSRYSDASFPLQYLNTLDDITTTKYFVETTKKNYLLGDISSILFLQSDCDTTTEREIYVQHLMQHIPIDSYGLCLNNKELPEKFKGDYLNNLNEDEFLHFVARYKFVIAIENGVCDDYVTEKLWRAIKVGSVPIYFGSPSVRDWLPNNRSAVLLNDYPTPKLMKQHIEKLLKDDKMYEEYLEHKIKQTISNQRLIAELRNNPAQSDVSAMIDKFQCMVCDKLHQKLDGILAKSVVTKSHYNCPKPISALSLTVNPKNDWIYTWEIAKKKAERIRKKLLIEN